MVYLVVLLNSGCGYATQTENQLDGAVFYGPEYRPTRTYDPEKQSLQECFKVCSLPTGQWQKINIGAQKKGINQESFIDWDKGVSYENVASVDLSGNELFHVTKELFKSDAWHNVEELNLSNNPLVIIDSDAFDYMPNLRILRLSNGVRFDSSAYPLLSCDVYQVTDEVFQKRQEHLARMKALLADFQKGSIALPRDIDEGYLERVNTMHGQSLLAKIACLLRR